MSDLLKARELGQRIIRGDLVAGIMSGDEVDQMVKLFETAGQTDASAFIELGDLYLSGMMYGMEPEPAVAAYRSAYEAKHPDGLSKYINTAYFYRNYVNLDGVDTASLVEELKSADETNQNLLMLGYFYQQGFGVEQSYTEAISYFEKAAAKDDHKSMFELYVMHANGMGVELDNASANSWLEKAAKAGSARAMFNYGGMYATGNGVEFDEAKSVEWYQKAVSAGHGRAAATLAYMHFTGEGAPLDEEKYQEYFETAYELGFDADAFFAQLGL